jgi:hypothetical protein
MDGERETQGSERGVYMFEISVGKESFVPREIKEEEEEQRLYLWKLGLER